MNNEPAVTLGSVSALIASVLALLVVFGVPVSDDMKVAVLAVSAAVWPFVQGLVTRAFVSPPGRLPPEPGSP